ncbi:NERD domain-containing protein [Bosea sp. 685]|uniref:NERD domain-containing protein n=1 Tax=Bosea sp. 685 TaxID=3080057 RepID=UPI0028930309|nr:NERD domain-containing protein [Bosea sp. 685]WNJ87940.1 NERD domain-containing protein [Bosea sp. 685]
MPPVDHTLRIYLGGPVAHASERVFLRALVARLESQRISAVVLANIMVNGRQLDCVVATPESVSVIEVKQSRLPLRGELNGQWARLTHQGEWAAYPNAYQQALDARFCLRDAMQSFTPIGQHYPQGVVVFAGRIPTGSQLPRGDFKTRILEIEPFLAVFPDGNGNPWPLDRWSEFARHLSLEPATLGEAVAEGKEADRLALIARYRAAVVAEHVEDAAAWLPESEDERDALRVAAWSETGCFVSGPSGCGKSLRAAWLASELAAAGHPTFFLAAKNFWGSWSASLRRELALLVDIEPQQLFRAVAQSDLSVFLIVDGCNEFGADARDALRGIRALARRFQARLILTSQDPKPTMFGGLNTVAANRPSLGLKQRIAVSAGGALPAIAEEVLRAIMSGIEAKIVGEIGSELRTGITRPLLIDQFARKLLGQHARLGARALREFASALHEQVAFSFSEAQFDDFMRTQDIGVAECDRLFSAGLLARRAGRVSFAHEMLQNACAAGALARVASSDPLAFAWRLSTPLVQPLAEDVIAAIDDGSVSRQLLEETADARLLARCAEGLCGPIAAAAASDLIDRSAAACVDEIRSANLQLTIDGDATRLEWQESAREAWTDAQIAQLAAIGLRAASGASIQAYLSLCAAMDERLAGERERWASLARQHRFPFRSQSFALAYYGFGPQIGFTRVARATQRGLEPAGLGMASYSWNVETLSSGQLLFFLEGRRRFRDAPDERFAEELIYLFRERFRFEPYHVQLAMLDSVGYARSAPDPVIQQLTEAITALEVSPTNVGINSSIIDALKILGAIEDPDDRQRQQIAAELVEVLQSDVSAVNPDLALTVAVSMFDHPYDTLYGEAIHELEDSQRHLLFCRALRAPSVRHSGSFGWLVRTVAAFNDPNDAELLKAFSCLPENANPFAQEEWAGFVAAIRFLARHRAGLAPIATGTPAEMCLGHLRMLVYAAESRLPEDLAQAALAWEFLRAMPVQLVVGCFSEIVGALTDDWSERTRDGASGTLNLVGAFVEESLTLMRRFVDEGEQPLFFHRAPFREKGTNFAFQVIGHYGDRSDIERLRKRSRGHPFAADAIAALKRLDMAAISTDS